jgi:hypothetical protein
MSDLKFELVKQVVSFGSSAVGLLHSQGFDAEAAKLNERVSAVQALLGLTHADRAALNGGLSIDSDALLDRLAGLESRATTIARLAVGSPRDLSEMTRFAVACALSGLATLVNGAALAIEASEA